MKNKILAFGEIIWDVYPDRKVIGGAPLNFAAHASICGAQSVLVSAVGNDLLGNAAITELGNLNIKSQFVKKAVEPTGQCIVTLDNNHIPTYNILENSAYDNIRLDDKDYLSINTEKFDAFYFGTLIQRSKVSKDTLHRLIKQCRFGRIICDMNIRPSCYSEESVLFCLTNANILKVSIEEEPIVRKFGKYNVKSETPGDIAVAICRKFRQVEIVIITLGKFGSYAYVARDEKEYWQDSIGDTVVSTVGAGDSFAAAWLTAYLQKEPMENCMRRAAQISGFVVAHTEAIPKYR